MTHELISYVDFGEKAAWYALYMIYGTLDGQREGCFALKLTNFKSVFKIMRFNGC